MAGPNGDGESVRRLGQALQAAGRGLNAATGDLSGQVTGLVPSGWAGRPADTFHSDWTSKAGRAGQLAAICGHVGGVLVDLGNAIDAANQQTARAQQMTGGPQSRFALPSTEQQSQRLQAQASGNAQQARSAARSKLAGIAVPRIGPPLTASQVNAWAQHLAPPAKQQPWYDSVLHGVGSFFSSLFGGNGGPPPKQPLSTANSFVQVSPHVWVPANDPKLPELKAAWAWASKRPVYLSGSPGDSEYTRWVDIFTVSPWAQDLNKGQLHNELGSFQPDARIGGAFNQHQNVILSTAGMGAAVFLGKPGSLIGLSPNAVRKLTQGWTSEAEPMPNAGQAQIDPRKLWAYSMDETNLQNQGKAEAWKRLGYNVDTAEGRQAAAEQVINQLRQQLPTDPAQINRMSGHGLRYETRTAIDGPDGQQGTLVSEWQYDQGSDMPRMITNWVEIPKPGAAQQTLSNSYTDGQGNRVTIKPGEPSASNPVERGLHLEVEQPGGAVSEVALQGNPALASDSPTLSVTPKDGETQYLDSKVPVDTGEPGGEGDVGDGVDGGGGGAVGGE